MPNRQVLKKNPDCHRPQTGSKKQQHHEMWKFDSVTLALLFVDPLPTPGCRNACVQSKMYSVPLQMPTSLMRPVHTNHFGGQSATSPALLWATRRGTQMQTKRDTASSKKASHTEEITTRAVKETMKGQKGYNRKQATRRCTHTQHLTPKESRRGSKGEYQGV